MSISGNDRVLLDGNARDSVVGLLARYEWRDDADEIAPRGSLHGLWRGRGPHGHKGLWSRSGQRLPGDGQGPLLERTHADPELGYRDADSLAFVQLIGVQAELVRVETEAIAIGEQ